MHGNMVFSTHYILGTPQQSGGFLVCSVQRHKKVYWPRGQYTMEYTFSDDNIAKYFCHVTVGYWGILRDIEGYWGILRNIEEYWGTEKLNFRHTAFEAYFHVLLGDVSKLPWCRVSQKRGAKNITWHSTSQCTYYEVQLSIVHLIIKKAN